MTGDRIIEIGVKRIEQGVAVRTFESLIDPEQRIPSFIEQLTGIRNEDLESAPTFGAIRHELETILDGCVFVAHNVRFDYGLIRNEFARVGRSFAAACLCSVRLSRRLYPHYRHHGLSELIRRFDLPCSRRHRALDDAQAVWAFMQAAHQDRGADRFARAVDVLLRTPTLPPRLPAEELQRLSDGPGVYVFYDATGQPLYVGKSRSVRSRVLSHFGADHRSGRTMRLCQHATRIEAHPTYGELGALLLESHLIKTRSPLYNQRARAQGALVVARRIDGERGYASIRLERREPKELLETSDVLGLFRSLRQAKEALRDLAKAHQLCLRVLGLERGRGRCIYRQLKQCRGACAGDEPPALFNARLEAAFVSRRLRRWPYPGPVLIEEANSSRTEGHRFIVDAWRLVRAIQYDESGMRPFLPAQVGFDQDVYRILVALLLRHGRSIRALSRSEKEQLCEQT